MKTLLALTAVGEAAAGLALLVYPPVMVRLLFGGEITGDGLVVSRLCGAALLAIGIACWIGKSDRGGPAQLGLLAGVLIYDATAAVILAYTGLFVTQAGIALCPAAVGHAVLAGWCLICLWGQRRGRG